MLKTLQFKVYNNKSTQKKYDEWIGICRYVYNLAKETKEESYKKGLKLSNYDLQKQFTDCKKEYKWLSKVHSGTLLSVFDKLDNTFLKYFRDLKNGKIKKDKDKYLNNKLSKGLLPNWKKYYNIGKPKWAKKEEYQTLEFKSIQQKEDYFILPKFGKIKVFNKEYITKYNVLKWKTGKLIKKADGLYLSVYVEIPDKQPTNKNQVCGIDMGIAKYCYTSDGQIFENPRALQNSLVKLRIKQRSLSRKFDKSKKEQSNNYKKQKIVVAKLHLKVARTRLDFIHKVTTELSKNYSDIVHEDLNVSGMIKNKKLSRDISDCAWEMFFDVLKTKTTTHKVNPAYTSQCCSKCNYIDKASRLTQSLFECTKCGFIENADKNASLNILKIFEEGVSSIRVKVKQ